MSDAQLRMQVHARQGAYLPHWTLDGARYHVVFRLADSLPANLVERYRAERDASLQTPAAKDPNSSSPQALRAHEEYNERIEAALDHGLGACWLGHEEIAALTANALNHFNDTRYMLHAWCVMPNHVHVIVQPLGGNDLPAILKSWKGFTALESNRLLDRSGEFWQPEYYDHVVRDEADLERTIRYIQDNPLRAGLQNWRWVWPPKKG